MIQKITNGEYLKRYDNMDTEERHVLTERVGQWLRDGGRMLMKRAEDQTATFLNAVQCSAGWNDKECEAWTEGAQLLTAFAGKADTWLPEMLYTKSAKRSIRNMVKVLWNAVAGETAGAVAAADRRETKKPVPLIKTAKREYDAATDTVMVQMEVVQDEPAKAPVQQNLKPGTLKPEVVRPKHIDQYVHLLPESTQKKAATVQGLLRELDVARENARLLMNDPNVKDGSRAQWAKMATTLDAKVKAIYKELDAEWEKLVQSGRVVVDIFGNASIVSDGKPSGAVAGGSTDAVAGGSAGAGADGGMADTTNEQKISAETKAQIKSLRSWLRDTRGPKKPGEKHDAYVARWKEKYREMVKLGGKEAVTEAVEKAAELYGISIEELQNNNTTDETKQ